MRIDKLRELYPSLSNEEIEELFPSLSIQELESLSSDIEEGYAVIDENNHIHQQAIHLLIQDVNGRILKLEEFWNTPLHGIVVKVKMSEENIDLLVSQLIDQLFKHSSLCVQTTPSGIHSITYKLCIHKDVHTYKVVLGFSTYNVVYQDKEYMWVNQTGTM